MFQRSLVVFISTIFIIIPINTLASSAEQYLKKAKDLSLASQTPWLDLLHFRHTLFRDTPQSEADDPAFFISSKGATNAAAELNASIKALFSPAGEHKHFSCRFPARSRWLTKTLDIRPNDLPDVKCPALEKFREQLNAQRVSLIFASTYLNSPSSMFGHTFLRIDASKSKDANLLLSNTISYAADAGQRDNELMFAYRGIFGGYPGVTSIVPYYEKLKQYIDMENRDIWEFELNFSQVEIDQLVDHAWELKDKNFDYYFFDENCAYRLLSLMDVARPGTDLIADVAYQAIPSDTVRWVVDKGLVETVHYRPSTSTVVQAQIKQLSEAEQQAVIALVQEGKPVEAILENFPGDKRKAYVLDTSYEYIRYDTVSSERTREETAKLSHRLLLARARLGQQPSMTPPELPDVRDDQGHHTVRIGARIGQVEHNDFVELDLRPAYHDLTDIPDGYPEGTQLRFLASRLRYWTKDNELDLEELTLIDINSITPRNSFFSPTSWKIAVGAIRSELTSERPLAAYVKGGAGLATDLFDGLLYGYAQGTLQSHRDLHKGYAIGPGLQAGWVRQRSNLQTLIQLDHEHFMEGNKTDTYEFSVQQGFRIGPNRQWMGSFYRRKTDGGYHSEWRLEFRQFL